MKEGPLYRLFVAHFPTARPAYDPDVERALADLLRRARTAWPALALPTEPLLAYVAARIPSGETTAAAMAAVHIEDLALAFACSRGQADALAIVEARFLPQVARYVAHTGATESMVSEVQQQLRVRLFVGERRAPEILDYAGRGPLGAWLRSAAIRMVRGLQRSRRKEVGPDALERLPRHPGEDPERDHLKRRYARALDAVLARVLADLPANERSILALHFLEGLSTDAIGKLYRVDGSTIRRRVAKLRQGILKLARRDLARELKLDRSEVESVLRLARSQLEVSVSRLLKQPRS
jgi:RNA polymerase sigma-70 factor (ECF subfamily)